jgi:hypothetical protein
MSSISINSTMYLSSMPSKTCDASMLLEVARRLLNARAHSLTVQHRHISVAQRISERIITFSHAGSQSLNGIFTSHEKVNRVYTSEGTKEKIGVSAGFRPGTKEIFLQKHIYSFFSGTGSGSMFQTEDKREQT